MNNSNEDKFIFILARQNLERYSREKLNNFKNNNLDWDYILNKSRLDSVSSFLYKHLTIISKYGFPPTRDILEELKNDYYRNLSRNIIIQSRLSKVLLAFKEAKIKIILLKGIVLCNTIYADISLRPLGDVDLLVKKEDCLKIDEILQSLGYSSNYSYQAFQAYLDKSNGNFICRIMYVPKDNTAPFFLHIHWHLVNHNLPMFYPKNIDMNKIWQEAETLEWGGIEIFTLSKAHMLLHLCDHSLRHAFSRLILLCDINEFIEKYKNQLNWDEVISEGRRFNLTRQLYYGLYFTKEFLDGNISHNLLNSVRPSQFSLWERKFITYILKQRCDEKLSYLIYFSMEKNLREKIRFLFRTFLPDIKTMDCIMLIREKRGYLFAYLDHILRGLYYGFKLISKIKIM